MREKMRENRREFEETNGLFEKELQRCSGNLLSIVNSAE